MRKKKNLRMWWQTIIPSIVCLIVFTYCKDDDKEVGAVYNPAEPVVVERYTPESGRVASQMVIYGSNFGSDISKIKVNVNGKMASVIGANKEGTIIYVIVPTLLGSDGIPEVVEEGFVVNVDIKVKVGENEQAQEVYSSKLFTYTFSKNVSTFLGFTDENGKTAIVDGPFEIAQFNEPFWLAYDEDKNVYLIEENNGLRFIDMNAKEVSTIFRTSSSFERPRTISYSLDYDTMLIANDASDWSNFGTIILMRDPETRRYKSDWKVAATHKQCNGGAIHPQSGEYFFNSYEQSQIFKMRRGPSMPWTYELVIPKVQDNNWEFNIQFAPSGRFAYIVSKNKHYIARAEYNSATKSLENPQPFVGTKEKGGYLDGVGLNALFREPHQGTFDEDDNFYLCDGMNHCIRKITPAGQVTTFAGRPENYGYSDGSLRDAQFDRPFGIIYDKDIKKFYIADEKNRRIRTIAVE